tara:strand:- start:238 stop:657 length:420 start_codon:yes stop_codon:yes gene_type:complete
MKDMTTGIEMTTFTTMEGDVLTTDTQPIITIDDSTFGDTTLNIIDYKFGENKYLQELREYIDSTYQGHYSTNKFQSTEVIIARGHGTGFCMGNVDKYANRYGKKGTREDARKDLLKVIHYALLQLHVHDSEEEEKLRSV